MRMRSCVRDIYTYKFEIFFKIMFMFLRTGNIRKVFFLKYFFQIQIKFRKRTSRKEHKYCI